MCGSEGNLYSMILGRELFPDAILYTSEESHLSIFKASLLFKIPIKKIKSQESGEIDYQDFEKQLKENKDKPAIINLNIGTTITGSVDNVDKILEILEKYQFKDRYHLHCDGDLLSMLLNQIDEKIVVPNFEKGIHSISISGHKFLGCPMPCGVVITYNHLVKALEQHIAYLNSIDTTITGSRNGQAALSMWYSLREKGRNVFVQEVKQCLENAQYLASKLSNIKIDSKVNYNIVMFTMPKNPDFMKKWQLLTHGDLAVVSIMPNITKEKIDAFIEDFNFELKNPSEMVKSHL
jgi:histidine decarboxylase